MWAYMSEESCEYHPSRVAKDKCHRCSRLICLSDTHEVRDTIKRRVSTSTVQKIPTQFTFCPVCQAEYFEQKVNSGKNLSYIVPIAFLLPMLIMFGVIFAYINTAFQDVPELGMINPGLFFVPVFVFALLIFGLMMFLLRRSQGEIREQAEEARHELETFLSGVENEEFKQKYHSQTELSCFQCGNAIKKNSRFCENCGDPTTEELEAYKEFD